MLANTRLDLNITTREEFALAREIGPELADKIIRYREEHGNFQSVEDLKNIPGITADQFKRAMSRVTVGGTTDTPTFR